MLNWYSDNFLGDCFVSPCLSPPNISFWQFPLFSSYVLPMSNVFFELALIISCYVWKPSMVVCLLWGNCQCSNELRSLYLGECEGPHGLYRYKDANCSIISKNLHAFMWVHMTLRMFTIIWLVLAPLASRHQKYKSKNNFGQYFAELWITEAIYIWHHDFDDVLLINVKQNYKHGISCLIRPFNFI